MSDVVELRYERLTESIVSVEAEGVTAYFLPSDAALRALWTTGRALVLASEAEDIKATFRRSVNNAHTGIEWHAGFVCPYCEFSTTRPRDFYQHLADVETRHVLSGRAKDDVLHKGMVAMAEARLQNRYAVNLRREREQAQP